MKDFTKISDRRSVDNVARFVILGCRLSDNFCKVENARFRVAFALSTFAGRYAEVKWIGRFSFLG